MGMGMPQPVFFHQYIWKMTGRFASMLFLNTMGIIWDPPPVSLALTGCHEHYSVSVSQLSHILT